MNIPGFEELLHNYDRQIELYRDLLARSQEQLAFLQDCEWSKNRAGLYDIARHRANLAEQCAQLDELNRGYQQQIISDLGVDSFQLSTLGPRMNQQDLQRLKEAVLSIGELLTRIQDLDDQCLKIINENQRISASDSMSSSTAFKQASQAYSKNFKPR